MRTFRKSAVSRDNPEYLIRNKYMLLHQDGNKYFNAADRQAHIIPTIKPLTCINLEARFGLSKDSPYHTKYTWVNKGTSSVFNLESPLRAQSSRRLEPVSPHMFLRECLRKSKGNTPAFNSLVRTQTTLASPQPKMFTLLMRRSASQEDKVRQSLVNPYNVEALHSSIARGEDSPYSRMLKTYTAKIRRTIRTRSRDVNRQTTQSARSVFMITETHSKNGIHN
jgi:hypothetical protein